MQTFYSVQQRGRALTLDSNEVDWLICHVTGTTTATLLAYPGQALSAVQSDQIEKLFQQRLQGVPLAYLIGYQGFWKHDFKVNPSVLIPRAETELLVELALQFEADHKKPISVLELGTGSGCIAISLALDCPDWSITATDLSLEALIVAKENATSLKANVNFIQSDWFENDLLTGPWDLIISNPPYIDNLDPEVEASVRHHEPHQALFAEREGDACLQVLVDASYERLKVGGWLLLEHGFQQGERVARMMEQRGYVRVETYKSLALHPRVTAGRKA